MASKPSTLQYRLAAMLLLACMACAPIQTPALETPTPRAATTAPVMATSRATIGGPIVSPFIDVEVTGVDIRYLPTKPVQVELLIRGELPDGCTYRFYALDNRQGQMVRVRLRAIHPPDTTCSQSVQAVEYVLPLERNLPESQRGFAPGTYELTVNNYQTTFSIEG